MNTLNANLAAIREAAQLLPVGRRNQVLNRCDRISVLFRRQMEQDTRTAAQEKESIVEHYNTTARIVAALISGRTLSQRDSQEFKTTAFHSRIADARRILSRQGYTLRSRYTTDAETLAGRAFKLYWIESL